MKRYVHTKIFMPMLIAALLIIAKKVETTQKLIKQNVIYPNNGILF